MGADTLLIIGHSGSGKSTALRNLPSEQTFIVKPEPKALPFPGGEAKYTEGVNCYTSNSMANANAMLLKAAATNRFKYFVIEDLNHYLNARTTSASFIAQNSGNAAFSKWNQFAADVIQSFFGVANKLPAGSFLFILAHTETKDDGTVGLQTSGKLLDNSLYVPGYVTYVLHGLVMGDPKDPDYKFLTNADGSHLAKSPAGCLERYVYNDLFKIVQRIEAYKKGENVDVKWKE